MWIHSHKHEYSKDAYAKIGAFLAVKFACMAKVSFRRSRCRWYTQDLLSNPGVLEQQPSDEGKDFRLSSTLK